MGDANRVKMSYRKEVTFGVFDNTGNLKQLRFASESFSQKATTDTSKEIRDDRQVPDVQRLKVNASGDISSPLSYGTFDELMQIAMFSSAWAGGASVSGTIYSVTAGSGQFTITRASGDFTAGGGTTFVANQWIRTRGFANGSNNGIGKVVSVTTTTIVVKGMGNGTNESAGATVTIEQGEQIVNGTTQASVTVQKQFADMVNAYQQFLGMTLGGFTWAYGAGEFVDIGFSLVGKKGPSSATTLGTVDAPNTKPNYQAVDHVTKTLIGYVDTAVTRFNFALSNNLRERDVAGQIGPESIGAGRHAVTGTVSRYFKTKAELDAFLDFTKQPLAVVFDDKSAAVSNAYVLDLPCAKFSTADPAAGGADTDVMLDCDFAAFIDPVELITTRIVRFPAA